ncbi:choice-of-anchor A family protein [Spirosoma sp. KNUC1025]|uniref:choice-of-anchor A family protein n=1 Tax=Spirosoma sp. KNUC1025 TaxID=2894082 RepID=UPI00386F5A15|nr:choice-of-anchor A family protein [Spirosoma sp. KNUC1025]
MLLVLFIGFAGKTIAQNPLAAANKFNVFLAGNATLTTNESEGAVGIGGNLTVAGNYQVAVRNNAISFTVNGYPIGLVVGGGVKLQQGTLQVNSNTSAKIGSCLGNASTDALKVWYKDNNGAYSTMRITKSTAGYSDTPNILINKNANSSTETNSPICQGDVVDFTHSFVALTNNSLSLSQKESRVKLTNPNGHPISETNLPSQVKIGLYSGINVWNVTGADLNQIQNLTYTDAPSSNQVLIINVNAMGSFRWNTPSLGGVSGNNAPYILWNFYNTTQLSIEGNSTIEGSLLAPLANVVKTVNQSNIEGQLIANSFVQSGGEMHHYPFNADVVTVPLGDVQLSISGTVFDDANGLVDGTVNGKAVSSLSDNTFYVNLVSSNGKVLASTALSSGTYSFTGITANTSYSLILTNSAGTVGNNPPGASLTNNVVNTGEHIGSGAGNDGMADGIIAVAVTTTSISEANFGVDKKPVADAKTAAAQLNPGGSNTVTVPTLTGSDLEDGTYTGISLSNTLVITSLASNGTLYYDNSLVTLNQVIANYDPTKLKADPTDGSVIVSFTYAQRDAASLLSPPATVTMQFGLPDLTPIIYARPSTVYGTTNITVVVDIFELKGIATKGLVTVKLNKDPKVSLSFPATATSAGGRNVTNSAWTFDADSDEDYYVLTTNQSIDAGNILSFGLVGKLTPGATSGTLTFTTVIDGGSGSEGIITNNTDADKIDFFQQ